MGGPHFFVVTTTKSFYDRRMTIAEIADALRSAREQAGRSQHEVAQALGTLQQQLARWEAGRYGLTLTSLIEWAEALDYEVVVRKRGE
jgi:transcriptional regulator with XRE-family HTH domain